MFSNLFLLFSCLLFTCVYVSTIEAYSSASVSISPFTARNNNDIYRKNGISKRNNVYKRFDVASKGIYVDYNYPHSPLANLQPLPPGDPRLHHRKSYDKLENEDEYDDDDDDDDGDEDDDNDDDDENDDIDEDEHLHHRDQMHYLVAKARLAARLVRERYDMQRLKQYNLDLNTRALSSKLANYQNDLNREVLYKLELLSQHPYHQTGDGTDVPLAPNLNNIPIEGGNYGELTNGLTFGDFMNMNNNPNNPNNEKNIDDMQRLNEHLHSAELMQHAEMNQPVDAVPVESAIPSFVHNEEIQTQNEIVPQPVIDPVAAADQATYSLTPLANDISRAATKATAEHLYNKFATLDEHLMEAVSNKDPIEKNDAHKAAVVAVTRTVKLNNETGIAKESNKANSTGRKRPTVRSTVSKYKKFDLKMMLNEINPKNSIIDENNVSENIIKTFKPIEAKARTKNNGFQRTIINIPNESMIDDSDADSFKKTIWKLDRIIDRLSNSKKTNTTANSKNHPKDEEQKNKKIIKLNETKSSPINPTGDNKKKHKMDKQEMEMIKKKYITYKRLLKEVKNQTRSVYSIGPDKRPQPMPNTESKYIVHGINTKIKTEIVSNNNKLRISNPRPRLDKDNMLVLPDVTTKVLIPKKTSTNISKEHSTENAITSKVQTKTVKSDNKLQTKLSEYTTPKENTDDKFQTKAVLKFQSNIVGQPTEHNAVSNKSNIGPDITDNDITNNNKLFVDIEKNFQSTSPRTESRKQDTKIKLATQHNVKLNMLPKMFAKVYKQPAKNKSKNNNKVGKLQTLVDTTKHNNTNRNLQTSNKGIDEGVESNMQIAKITADKNDGGGNKMKNSTNSKLHNSTKSRNKIQNDLKSLKEEIRTKYLTYKKLRAKVKGQNKSVATLEPEALILNEILANTSKLNRKKTKINFQLNQRNIPSKENNTKTMNVMKTPVQNIKVLILKEQDLNKQKILKVQKFREQIAKQSKSMQPVQKQQNVMQTDVKTQLEYQRKHNVQSNKETWVVELNR